MQLNTITNQTIALAGIAQAAALVQQLATTGMADATAMEASIASVLKIDSDSVIDVYGGLSGIKLFLPAPFHITSTHISFSGRVVLG